MIDFALETERTSGRIPRDRSTRLAFCVSADHDDHHAALLVACRSLSAPHRLRAEALSASRLSRADVSQPYAFYTGCLYLLVVFSYGKSLGLEEAVPRSRP